MIDPTLAQQIVESSTDFAIIAFDDGGRITSWNPGAQTLLAWSTGEAIAAQGRMIFTEEDQVAGSPEHDTERALSDGRTVARSHGRTVDERLRLRGDGAFKVWAS